MSDGKYEEATRYIKIEIQERMKGERKIIKTENV